MLKLSKIFYKRYVSKSHSITTKYNVMRPKTNKTSFIFQHQIIIEKSKLKKNKTKILNCVITKNGIYLFYCTSYIERECIRKRLTKLIPFQYIIINDINNFFKE